MATVTPAGLCAVAMLMLGSCGERSASAGLSMPHPDDAAKRVEYFVERPRGNGPWPMIVLLHGHQAGARPGGRDFVEWGVLTELAARGYLAVAVSQPGYGNSTGPADFSGDFTQHAVSAVIARLRSNGSAAPRKLVLLGISRGAIAAGLLAANDPSVSGLVMISGVYDLTAYVAEPRPSSAKALVTRSIVAETGATAAALAARSILPVAHEIEAAVLILNGAKDDRTDPEQARGLAGLIRENGGRARAIIYPDFGHMIPVAVRNEDIDPFIDLVLRTASSP